MTAASTLHLQINGRVQGVGFRDATCVRARELGLQGWVRNRRDGSVELLAIGSIAACTALQEWAHHGPAAAQVREIKVLETDPKLLALLDLQGEAFNQAPTL